MKRGWNPELEALVRRADPVARLIPEIAAIAAEDVRERSDEWSGADSLAGLRVRPDGGVEIQGVQHTLVESAVSGGYMVALNRDAVLSGAIDMARLEWPGADAGEFWEPREVVMELVAQLDPAFPREVDAWGVQLLWLESHTRSQGAQTEPLEYSFFALHEPVYVPAAGGVNPGPVSVDYVLLGMEVRQALRAPVFTGRYRDTAAALPPTGFVHVWALKADGTPAENVGWAVDPTRASHTDPDSGTRLQRFTAIGENGLTGGQSVNQVPRVSLYGHTFAEAMATFSGANQVDLGSVPAADVELVGQGAQPSGTAVVWEVMADDGAWTPFADGDLAGVDNSQQGGTDLSPAAAHPVGRRQTYSLRARLIPSATTSPVASAIGARALERILFDGGEALWRQSGAWAFDPITSVAEVTEGTLTILRTGDYDYRDPASEIFTRYYVGELSVRLWIGHPGLGRDKWLLVDSFLVEDYDSHGGAFDVLCISPLAYTRAKIPPAERSGGAAATAPLVFANTPIRDAYSALLESAVALPERYRGSGIPETVEWTVSKRITDADAKTELDALARLAGGAMICSQGRVRFVDIAGLKPVAAVLERDELKEERITPGLRHRAPEFFVPYLWADATEGGQARYRSLVRSFNVLALEKLGTATLDAPREMEDTVARWIDTDELANAAARQVTEAVGPGLMLWSFTAKSAYPELEPGDLVAVEVTGFAARDLVGGREVRGRVWALGVVQSVGDPWGRQLNVWVRRYSDVFVGSEPVDTGGFGGAAEVVSAQKANDGPLATITTFHNAETARGGGKGRWRVNGGAATAFTIDGDGTGQFDVERSEQAIITVEIRGENAAGLAGPWFALLVDRYDPPVDPPPLPVMLTGVDLVVTDTGVGGDDVYEGSVSGSGMLGKAVEVRYYRGASLRHTAVVDPVMSDSLLDLAWTDVGIGDANSNQHAVEVDLYAGSTAHGTLRSRAVQSLILA